MPPIFRAEGLAWDDEPVYMEMLADTLKNLEIRLEVVRTAEEFRAGFNSKSWDFVVLDLLDETRSPPKPRGVDLARDVNASVDRFFPIFIITNQPSLLQSTQLKDLPPNANVRYKIEDTYPMAVMIRDELRLRGAYTDPRKLFLVAPMVNNQPSSEAREVQEWLREHGHDVKPLNQRTLGAEILQTLLLEMSACRAVIVLCTADDPGPRDLLLPRQNVILELGMALGIGRGLRSLIILKQETAELPSDLGGVVTMNFKRSPSEIFSQLEQKLEDLGVDLSPTASS